MKKILLIIVLMLLSINVFAQKIQFIDTLNGNPILREVSYKYPLPVRLLNFNNLLDTLRIGYLDKENTWLLPQIFRKAYVDSLIIRIYALDTGTNITKTILPITSSLYNLGSGDKVWNSIYSDTMTINKKLIVNRSGYEGLQYLSLYSQNSGSYIRNISQTGNDKILYVENLSSSPTQLSQNQIQLRVGTISSPITSLTIDSIGYVGINTANPSATLDVNGNVKINGNYFYIVGDETTNGSWKISATLNGDAVIQKRINGDWITMGTWSE